MVDDVPTFASPGFNLEATVSVLERNQLEALLLTSPVNVQYSTGYPALPSAGNPILHTLENQFPFASYIGRDGRVTLACWLVSTLGVAFGADEVVSYLDHGGALDTIGRLAGRVAASGGRLGVESTVPLFVVKLFEEAGGSREQLVVIDEDLLALRLRKSPQERALLERSIGIVEKTVTEIHGVLEVGMSRLDLITEAKYRMLRNGATGISHVTISFGTANPELAIGETLQEGKLVTLDLGATLEGYCSDNRRYAFFGELPDDLARTHALMVDVVDGVGAALVPGVSEGDVYARGVKLFEEAGLDPYFLHVGHHIGLQTEESWLTSASKRCVEDGMVVNIELYTPVAGVDFVGDEETFVVGPGGSRRISQLPREIVTLR